MNNTYIASTEFITDGVTPSTLVSCYANSNTVGYNIDYAITVQPFGYYSNPKPNVQAMVDYNTSDGNNASCIGSIEPLPNTSKLNLLSDEYAIGGDVFKLKIGAVNGLQAIWEQSKLYTSSSLVKGEEVGQILTDIINEFTNILNTQLEQFGESLYDALNNLDRYYTCNNLPLTRVKYIPIPTIYTPSGVIAKDTQYIAKGGILINEAGDIKNE